MKDLLVSQDETSEDTQIRNARLAGMMALSRMSEEDFDRVFAEGEKGSFEVTPLVELKNVTDEFNIVGFHERGCGCTSEKRNAKCFPARNLPN